MRNNIVHPDADKLEYEIRGITKVAQKIESLGQKIIWENIGDPVIKGEEVSPWIKDIVKKESENNDSYGYCPTAGIYETRKYISDYKKNVEGIDVEADDILFFNGLGDAIATIYSYLHHGSKIIGPNPAYPTHSSAESAHSGLKHITYSLKPENNWEPDLAEMENKIKYNPSISGILIINPDNPTGYVYSKEILEKIVSLAKKYNLFLISDEIYKNLTYNQDSFISVGKIASEKKVPAIILRGLSKEIPWPGSRCGWAEFICRKEDSNFDRYVQSLINAKMLEVCSTTLPQKVIPEIFQDPRYEKLLNNRSKKYQERAKMATKIFQKNNNILAPMPSGAFYLTVVFKKSNNEKYKLKIENPEIKKYLDSVLKKDFSLDKKFVYYLMASTGICLVPLSSFNSELQGFRMTLLETDSEKLKKNVETILEKMEEFFQ